MLPSDSQATSRLSRFNLLQSVYAEGLIVVALVAWWLGSLVLPSYAMPGPVEVFLAMGRLLVDPDFAVHSFATASRILIAIVFAMLIGGGLAMLPRYVPEFGIFVNERVRPIMNSFPSIGWAILGSIWFGVSWTAVIFVQTAILIPFTMINISEGLREISSEEQEMARSFTRNKWRAFSLVIFPMLFPYLVTAVRISYGVAWKISLVAELFGARIGLGTLILQSQTNNRIDIVFAVCLMIVVFFILGEKLVLAPLARLYRAPQRI